MTLLDCLIIKTWKSLCVRSGTTTYNTHFNYTFKSIVLKVNWIILITCVYIFLCDYVILWHKAVLASCSMKDLVSSVRYAETKLVNSISSSLSGVLFSLLFWHCNGILWYVSSRRICLMDSLCCCCRINRRCTSCTFCSFDGGMTVWILVLFDIRFSWQAGQYLCDDCRSTVDLQLDPAQRTRLRLLLRLPIMRAKKNSWSGYWLLWLCSTKRNEMSKK